MPELTDEEMNELAIKVAVRLESTQVTRLIPKEIQAAYAKASYGYPMTQMQVIPIGSAMILMDFKIDPDGSMHLTLSDTNHQHFWSAHLTSEV